MATSAQKKYLTPAQEAYFPNLKRSDYFVTSDPTPTYNCIAHAAGSDAAWWWPDDYAPNGHWPEGVEKLETMDAFVAAYATKGYAVCDSQARVLEAGVEKVAIFVDVDGVPTHAARQLSDGAWTSKLGESEDIRHETLEALEGGDGQGVGYGHVELILRRATAKGDN